MNNDGENELLIQHSYGAHSAVLSVYGWKRRYLEFGKLAEIMTGPPSSFTVGDLDGDGRVEVATVDVDWESGLSYAEGARKEVLYRWEGDGFVQVAERPLPRDQGDWELRWHTKPIA